MSIKSVLALSNSVNTITEKDSENITTKARLEIRLVSPSSVAPITMGSSGKIHGANTVKTPARIAIMKKIILLYL